MVRVIVKNWCKVLNVIFFIVLLLLLLQTALASEASSLCVENILRDLIKETSSIKPKGRFLLDSMNSVEKFLTKNGVKFQQVLLKHKGVHNGIVISSQGDHPLNQFAKYIENRFHTHLTYSISEHNAFPGARAFSKIDEGRILLPHNAIKTLATDQTSFHEILHAAIANEAKQGNSHLAHLFIEGNTNITGYANYFSFEEIYAHSLNVFYSIELVKRKNFFVKLRTQEKLNHYIRKTRRQIKQILKTLTGAIEKFEKAPDINFKSFSSTTDRHSLKGADLSYLTYEVPRNDGMMFSTLKITVPLPRTLGDKLTVLQKKEFILKKIKLQQSLLQELKVRFDKLAITGHVPFYDFGGKKTESVTKEIQRIFKKYNYEYKKLYSDIKKSVLQE